MNTKENSCDGKKKFTEDIDAVLAIRHMVRDGIKNPWELHSYKCDYCDGFHVGHMLNGQQKLVQTFIKSKRPQPPLIKMKRD